MLAIATADTLHLCDPSALKRSPVLLPAPCFVSNPVASVWSSDNSALYIAHKREIHQYDPAGDQVKQIYSAVNSDDELAPCIVSKDKGNSLVFAVSNKVHVLEITSATGGTKVSNTFEPHKLPITSLSLSNDSTLLASTSNAAIYIHNLSLCSHTALRGLPQSSESTTRTLTCTFSPHLRTRLIVGSAKTLYIYDITRPSSPTRTISMGDISSGDIVAIACSPFSKTLVAAACSGGTVGLIDLDKEKGLFKTINMNVPLTSLAFSSEGAAMYLGTENGKLLLQDLRALDKAPKSVTVSDRGHPIECLSVQRKLKTEPVPKSTTATAVADTKLLTQQDINKKPVQVRKASASANLVKHPSSTVIINKTATPSPARSTPVRKRAISGALGGYKSPPLRLKTTSTATDRSPGARKVSSPALNKIRTVFSPPRGSPRDQAPQDVSVQIEALLVPKRTTNMNKENRGKAPHKSPLASQSAVRKPISSPSRLSTNQTRRVVSASAVTTVDSKDPKPIRQQAITIRSSISSDNLKSRRRGSATSGASPGNSKVELSPPSHAMSRAGSSASQRKALARTSSPPTMRKRISSLPSPARASTVPDLPPPSAEPITPCKVKKSSRAVFDLATPGLDKWVELGKRKTVRTMESRRQVGFAFADDDEELFDEQERSRIEEVLEEENEEAEAERQFKKKQESKMQVSPVRHSASEKRNSWAPVPSPLRRGLSSPAGGLPGLSSTSAGAHNLLHSIMRDVMYDYQEDMRTEMMGMHLDLVRMGRDWKKEMKEMTAVYSKDLRELREENRLLREENERLRRGY